MAAPPEPEKLPPALNSVVEPQSERSPHVVDGRLLELERIYGSTWDSPTDPADPYNWPSLRKISIGLVFSFGQLVTLMSASMIAAALGDIERDLGIDATTAQITFSTYFLGLAVGPFPIAAWSEMSGRKRVWLFANAWFILWNALCPVGRSKGLMIAGRFMTGVGASAGITLTGPVMSDMYRNEDRGKSLAIASLLPYLGPALGPIVGGLVTQLVDWPWIFWIMSVFNAIVTLLGLFCIRETYAPELLRRKTKARLDDSPALPPSTANPNSLAFLPRLRAHLARPFTLLKRPIIQLIAVLVALDFAIYTFLLSTFATLYMEQYSQSPFVSSLHYLSISAGFTLAAQIGGRVMDWIYLRLCNREETNTATTADNTIPNQDQTQPRSQNQGPAHTTIRRQEPKGRPEFRIPYLLPGFLLLPLGLLIYGWAATYNIHWVAVDLGAIVFTAGSVIVTQALFAYLLDEFSSSSSSASASANAASRVVSNLLAFGFPIFAPRLYYRDADDGDGGLGWGYGWGNSFLALVWVVVASPMVLGLWFWGPKLRAFGRGGGTAA